jgi:hypothetical protein
LSQAITVASMSSVAVLTGRALQIEDQFSIGLGQTQQRRRLGRHVGFALLQQRQIRDMKLREKIPRGLCRRQIMPKQQRQRLVLAKLVEVFRPLAADRPQRQQALRHRRGAQTPLAALQLDLPVDHCRRPGLSERLDQSGHPRMPGDQPRLQLAINLEIQPRCHSLPPPHPAGETYPSTRTKAESMTFL